MSAAHPPVATIPPGQCVTVETMDALDGRVVAVDGTVVADGRSGLANPATGPLYVEGVRPGDGVAVRLLDVRPVGLGYIGTHAGALGGKVGEELRLFVRPDGGRVRLPGGVQWPVAPMVGVIGLAPVEGEVGNQSPGDHGGNLDTSLIRAGATVYLRAAHDGGLLALGDVHTLMGDGEVNGQGVETYAEVDIQVEVRRGWRASRPVVETADVWATIASDEDLERAARAASRDMVDLVMRLTGIGSAEAFLLIGMVGDVRVSQMVNPLRTARVEVPKRALGL